MMLATKQMNLDFVLSTGEVDRQGDRVDQKSMRAALTTFMKRSGVVVWNHDWQAGGIGRVVEHDTQGDKTLVRIRYGKGYALAGGLTVDDIWAQIDQGIVRTHSHAFSCDRSPVAGKSNEFDCFVKDMFEVSVVIVPANANATFDAVKRYLINTRQIQGQPGHLPATYAGFEPEEQPETEQAARLLMQKLTEQRRLIRGDR
jgi:hypothetical protein